jgi:ADP-ribose pyrophosphatase YjhB (NUDIX family)
VNKWDSGIVIVIVVFVLNKEKLLFCKRAKNPYKGLFNFVGGKSGAGRDTVSMQLIGIFLKNLVFLG